MSKRQELYAAIDAERARQDRRWGGSEHDCRHSANDWAAYLVCYTGKAVEAVEEGKIVPDNPLDERRGAPWPTRVPDWDQYRRRLIQVAALAVAAIESMDKEAT